MIIACEAVTRAGSACAIDDEGRELARVRLERGETAARLPLVLHDLLERHGRPRELAVAVGPGSFTGLRVAVVAVRTLAWYEGLRVRAVDSLAAIAASLGDGLWWTLMPLKRDVTFHALYRVSERRLHCLVPVAAARDDDPPALGSDHPGAVAVGPALADKPGLLECWAPGVRRGPAVPCDAHAVALAAGDSPLLDWRDLRPAYHMASAPELQRRAARG